MSQQQLSRFFSVQKKEGPRKQDAADVERQKRVDDALAEQAQVKKLKTQLGGFVCGVADPARVVEPRKRKAVDVKVEKKSKPKKLTDMEQQVMELKTAHLDKLLLVQVGYRYKFFGYDAEIASKILNIKLTEGRLSFDIERPGRDDHLFSSFAQSSIPIERLFVHIRRLLVKGYVVGVVDQIESAVVRDNAVDAVKSKVFERKLSNVYSPGTFITDEDLDRGAVNGKSILCVGEGVDGVVSVVSVNVFVSQIVYDQFDDDYTMVNLESRLHHLEPIEIITVGDVSESTKACLRNFIRLKGESGRIHNVTVDGGHVQFNELLSELQQEISDENVFAFLVEQNQGLLTCFMSLIRYLKNYNLHSLFNLFEIYTRFSDIEKTTILDSNVIKSLEIFTNSTTATEDGSLFNIINQTNTKFGQRVLRNWLCRPLIDTALISQRHEAVECLIGKMNSLQVERVVNVIKGCPDLKLMMSRIYHNRSNRKEVYLFLKKIDDILVVFKGIRDELITKDVLDSELVCSFYTDMKHLAVTELTDLRELLDMIYSPNAMDTKSDAHITGYFNNKFFMYAEIQAELDKIEGIKDELNIELKDIRKVLKSDEIEFFKVSNEPYLIQIRNSLVKFVPKDWVRISATANCVRFRSPITVKLYKKLLYQKEMLKSTCNRMFSEFNGRLSQYQVSLTKAVNKIGEFDALLSFAKVSMNNKYSKPRVVDSPTIQLIGSRNLIAERLMQLKPYSTQTTNAYIENDFAMQSELNQSRIGLITGPNMGGKSSFLRQVGLIVILSQIGCFVPCNPGSTIGIFANIHIRLGSNDDIFAGKSTFQIELTECRNILSSCSTTQGNSLLLIDELGRGTSTVDGCSIAWAVLDHLVRNMGVDVMVLFITHFKELDEFENRSNGIVKNYHLNFDLLNDNKDIMFTYKITPGSGSGSYGVYCAKIAGIPDEVVDNADRISKEVELHNEKNKCMSLVRSINAKNLDRLFQLAEFL